MKKPSSKIREEIARLHEQLKAAETREAERIGRVALKAGLGEIEIEEAALLSAFEDLAGRFRTGGGKSTGKKNAGAGRSASDAAATLASGAAQGGDHEA
ncbi:TraC family protein [Mesorhizobium sp. M1A.F.Ca.IN.020.06.1.1]|uniref:conjugal transfer protein TraC n=2 Tax=Mesorhizobium TaxID=68287 RepID=UPI000FD3FA15|nr:MULTISPECIES: conjugal transfer protein TraC [unclassified Mesorhizobium]RUW17910.1 TraC family protein [Mesorhizobium sp. M1A.F.Ca.IN.020.06.1.1]RWF72558.1 MAG: TraC family protein [Mesorhizobium sp.]RWG04546.1 MAG: TraC family protein [Mesorhizobium sp.]RWG90616.1 MAG: TraC family protein [Mesorhizobium sp.]RWG94095.1 MAG: TraC family protein [Mesorhizobium sp.]